MAEADSVSAQQAVTLKDQGNEAFKALRLRTALEFYEKSIAVHPTAACYGNLAAVHIKLEEFGSAILDADNAIKVDPKYIKAYYRKGSAYIGLGKYKQALKLFEAVVKVKRRSKAAKAKLEQCRKIVTRERFLKAITSDDAPPASTTIDPSQILVEATYDGPCLAADGISLEFVKATMEHFKAQKLLHRKFVVQLLLQTIELLKTKPSLVDISIPRVEGIEPKITVCGDTHGQFYDLCNIFGINGLPSPTNPYLFNGDFVDRGSFGVENMLTLFSWQLLYPRAVFLSRGNHETKNMNKIYGFEGEVLHKYDAEVMKLFAEAFQWLPLCSVIEKRVFVVHGGIFSTDNVTLDEIRKIKRDSEPPDTGPFCDMLWADPSPFMGRHPSKRGVSSRDFGEDITKAFLAHNNLDLLVRSHEVQEEGYKVMHDGKCVTVFSAPNYCDQMGNKGAMMVFDKDMVPTFKQFTAVPHPPIKPMAYAPMMNMFGF